MLQVLTKHFKVWNNLTCGFRLENFYLVCQNQPNLHIFVKSQQSRILFWKGTTFSKSYLRLSVT